MLYISQNGTNFEREWHVGEPVPPIRGRVIQFQADGDELDLILRAMEAKCYASCPGHGFVHP